MGCVMNVCTQKTDELQSLKNVVDANKENILFETYNFTKAFVLDVYDGDTYTVAAVHHDIVTKFKVRLYGYNAPEVKGDEKKFGIIVRDHVRDLIHNKYVDIVVVTNNNKNLQDKYGRLLCRIKTPIDKSDLGETLEKIGYVKPYDGGKKEKFETENHDT
jgi:endonuclease YncB( thermonuclease family)